MYCSTLGSNYVKQGLSYHPTDKMIQNCCCHYFYVVRNYEKMKLAEKDEMIREHVKRRKQYEADGELRHTMITHSVVENDLELSGSEISRV